MISISNTGNSIRFTFKDSDHYLQNGTIDAPLNSIALVIDDSDMATFKKAMSGDVLFSLPLSELGMSKEQLMSFYKSSMVGEGTGGGGGGGAQIRIIVVDRLPDVGETDAIYLVPKVGSKDDSYYEYLYINGKWELIGSTDVKLDDYYTKGDIDSKLTLINQALELKQNKLYVDNETLVAE